MCIPLFKINSNAHDIDAKMINLATVREEKM